MFCWYVVTSTQFSVAGSHLASDIDHLTLSAP